MKKKLISSIVIAILLVISYNKIMIDNPEFIEKFLDIDLGVDLRNDVREPIVSMETNNKDKRVPASPPKADTTQGMTAQESRPIDSISENTSKKIIIDQNLNKIIADLTEKIDKLENHLEENEKDKKETSITFQKLPKSPIHYNPESLNGVALTFDCLSGSNKPEEVLQILKNRDLQVTFFLEKSWTMKNSTLINQIIYDGHEIGYLESPDADEIFDISFDNIFTTNFGVSTIPLYRSYKNNDLDLIPLLEDNSSKLILWSINGDDYKNEMNKIKTIIQPGDIVRFDCNSNDVIDFLPEYLRYLRDSNLNTIKVSELF